MLTIKPGVKLCGLRPEMVLAIAIINDVWEEFVPQCDCTITSVIDGQHSKGSLHYVGCAVDFRIRDVPERQRDTIREQSEKRLGSEEFDVVLNADAPCLHVEWQPK